MIRTTQHDPAEKLGFEIRRRRNRNGFVLQSPIFLFPLCYQTLNEAVSSARFIGRDRGCKISIRNSKGTLIDTIEIDARHNRWMNQPRMFDFQAPAIGRRSNGRPSKTRLTKTRRRFQCVSLEGA